MSEYYCSHKPPCCPKMKSLESQLRAADELAKAVKVWADRWFDDREDEMISNVDVALEAWRKAAGK